MSCWSFWHHASSENENVSTKAKGDGSDPHGESLLGNGASSQDDGDTVSSGGGTPTGKEDLYQQIFEESYDLFDPDYILWLEQHHPEALPANRYKLTSAPSGGMPPGGSASSPSLSSSHPITPESLAKTTPPGGSASSLSLSSSQPITPESSAKTTLHGGSASSLSLSPAHSQSLLSLRPRQRSLVVRQVLPLSPAHSQSLLSLRPRLRPLVVR